MMKYFADIISSITEPLNLIALLCLLLAGITWKFSGRAKNRWMLPSLFVLFSVIIILVSTQQDSNNGKNSQASQTSQTSLGNNSPNIINNGSGSVITSTNNNESDSHSPKQTDHE